MTLLTESVASLFGFQIKRPEEEQIQQLPSFSPKLEDDGAVVVAAGSSYGTYIDLDGSVRSEAELVTKYRDMSLNPEIDMAVEDIIDAAIVTEDGEKTVELILDDIPILPAKIKKIIEEEFESILNLLEFNSKQYEVFRRFYIDGRLYYHAIIDPKVPSLGIQEIRYLDPRRIRKIREVSKRRDKSNPQVITTKTVNEYYLYSDKGFASTSKAPSSTVGTTGIKIAPDSIIHCTSGLTDSNGSMILSFLHKAIKPLNQLRSLEDATLIYRISRAPERRIFYIDVGNLPRIKAEQYVRDMMTKHKNKLVYDASTGQIRDDRKFMTMMEDFWLPRREGGKGTEITTLPAGQNLGELADVEYFQRKLYKSLNVPISRLEPETFYNVGRSSEITRDEVKFAKFIDRLRMRFCVLFTKALEKQLILKKIINPSDWKKIEGKLQYRFLEDNYYSELKDFEIMAERFSRVEQAIMYAGKYYPHDWIRRTILKQTDLEMEQYDQKIAEEAANPQFQDVNAQGPDAGFGPPGPDNIDQGGPPAQSDQPPEPPPKRGKKQ